MKWKLNWAVLADCIFYKAIYSFRFLNKKISKLTVHCFFQIFCLRPHVYCTCFGGPNTYTVSNLWCFMFLLFLWFGFYIPTVFISLFNPNLSVSNFWFYLVNLARAYGRVRYGPCSCATRHGSGPPIAMWSMVHSLPLKMGFLIVQQELMALKMDMLRRLLIMISPEVGS